MDKGSSLARLFAPKTIAFFGGNDAADAIQQCQSANFEGEIWPVNPKRNTLCGLTCYPSANALPSVPDASFIATPPIPSVEIVRELSLSGAGGAVCFASGFAELNEAGAGLQQQLLEAAGAMPVIGPNCHGFLNYLDNVILWPDQHGGSPTDRGVALVTQSGNFGINLSMQQRSLDIGYVVTIGNKSCLGLHDYIDFLIEDPRVSAIGLHLESIDCVHKFSMAAIRALKAGVPIAAIKTGRSARGAEINLSHTASLAGQDHLYSALFNRLGIARCDTVMQFLETLKFLSTVGTLPGNGLGSMSCSGGEASLIADYADKVSLSLPTLTSVSTEKLGEILGPKVPLSNPLDYHTYAWGDYDKLNACFTAMLGNGFDCTMLVLDYPPGGADQTANWEIAEQALTDAVEVSGHQAVIVSTLPETMPSDVRDRLKKSGITPMQGLEECLFAISAAAMIGSVRQKADDLLPILKPEINKNNLLLFDEWESKKRLQQAGLKIPNGYVCRAEEAPIIASKIGFPVVLKVVSTELAHKSDAGGVMVNLQNKKAVSDAIEKMPADFDHFLVEEMAGPVVAEIIIGVSRDEAFGLSLLIGAGGILVELLDDTVSLLLPVQKPEIEEAMRSLKVFNLIDSHRGRERGDFDATIDAIMAVAQFAVDNNATLAELDVNPLIIQPKGVIAVDALIRQYE